MSQRVTRAAALLAASLAAGGCAHAPVRSTPPIRVAAPRISVSRISLPPAEASGIAQFRRWPKACALLTPDDMRAVLPQITKVVETPFSQKIKITNLDDVGDDYDAPGTSCEIKFWVAGTELKKKAVPDVVRVEDLAVGDTDTVEDNYGSLAQGHPKIPGGLGALECVLDGEEYFCRMPKIAFAVSAGPTLYIDRFEGQPARTEARTYWVHDVLPNFVRSVASKLPQK